MILLGELICLLVRAAFASNARRAKVLVMWRGAIWQTWQSLIATFTTLTPPERFSSSAAYLD